MEGFTVNIPVDPQIPLSNTGTGVDPLPDNGTAVDQKSVFKAGLLMSIVAICTLLNPPLYTNSTIATASTTSIATKAHNLLSITFYFAIFLNLLFGITQICISFLLSYIPEIFSSLLHYIPEMAETGMVLMRATLGFGTSLVLMEASSSWLALYLLFISIQFL